MKKVIIELTLNDEGSKGDAPFTVAYLLLNRVKEVFANHPDYASFAITETVSAKVITEEIYV